MESLKKEKQDQTEKEYDEYTERQLQKRNNYTIEDRHILGESVFFLKSSFLKRILMENMKSIFKHYFQYRDSKNLLYKYI